MAPLLPGRGRHTVTLSHLKCPCQCRHAVPPPSFPCSTPACCRWRLYSLAEGDTLSRWRIEPFVMVSCCNRRVYFVGSLKKLSGRCARCCDKALLLRVTSDSLIELFNDHKQLVILSLPSAPLPLRPLFEGQRQSASGVPHHDCGPSPSASSHCSVSSAPLLRPLFEGQRQSASGVAHHDCVLF